MMTCLTGRLFAGAILPCAWLLLGGGCAGPAADPDPVSLAPADAAAAGPPPHRPSDGGGTDRGAASADGTPGPVVDSARGAAGEEDAVTDRVDAPASADAPVSEGPVAHRFLKGFSGGGSVAIVGKSGAIEWELPVSEHETNDAWLLANGNVLFAFKSGCREVDPAKKTVWEWKAAGGAETHSCQPLADGRYLVAESRGDGSSNLYEMDRAKTISKTVTIKMGGGSHNQLREARKTRQGTYLVTQQRGGGKAQEYDGEGKLVRSFPCGRFVAIRLPNGNTLVACGDEHRVIEVDPQDQIVWEVKETDIPGNTLGFVAGLQRLANGNTVICNWAGHSHRTDQPQVFELTPDKKVVWQVKNPKLGMISAIHILDPEALVDGEALR